MNYIIIKTSTNDIDVATDISNALLNRKLSPCVQIEKKCKVNFIWNDKTVNDNEHIVRIKTISVNKKDIVDVIMSYHNYDIPEITLKEETIINDEYARWFKKCLKK